MAYATREIGPFRKKYLKTRCNEDVSPYMHKKITKAQNLLLVNQGLNQQSENLQVR